MRQPTKIRIRRRGANLISSYIGMSLKRAYELRKRQAAKRSQKDPTMPMVWCCTKSITNGRVGSRAAKRHVARTWLVPFIVFAGQRQYFEPSCSGNFGLIAAKVHPPWHGYYRPVADGSRCSSKRRPSSAGRLAGANSPAAPARLTRRPHRSCRPYCRAISRPLGSEPSPARLASAHCHACRCRCRPAPLWPPGSPPWRLSPWGDLAGVARSRRQPPGGRSAV
jgi:hypothetical protein